MAYVVCFLAMPTRYAKITSKFGGMLALSLNGRTKIFEGAQPDVLVVAPFKNCAFLCEFEGEHAKLLNKIHVRRIDISRLSFFERAFSKREWEGRIYFNSPPTSGTTRIRYA